MSCNVKSFNFPGLKEFMNHFSITPILAITYKSCVQVQGLETLTTHLFKSWITRHMGIDEKAGDAFSKMKKKKKLMQRWRRRSIRSPSSKSVRSRQLRGARRRSRACNRTGQDAKGQWGSREEWFLKRACYWCTISQSDSSTQKRIITPLPYISRLENDAYWITTQKLPT